MSLLTTFEQYALKHLLGDAGPMLHSVLDGFGLQPNQFTRVVQTVTPAVTAADALKAADGTTPLTGPQKNGALDKTALLAELEQAGIKIGMVVLNIAIEVAVGYLQAKAGKLA